MKKYQDLQPPMKALFDSIDYLFISSPEMQQKDFVTVLAMLINKYKFKNVKP